MMYPEELYTGSGTLQGYPLSAHDPYHEETPGALAFDSSYASDSDLESWTSSPSVALWYVWHPLVHAIITHPL